MSYSLVGQTINKQYRVDAFVGSGGMGVVYRIWDLKRNAALAMKVLHADLAEDHQGFRGFEREARALKKLAHPNIVPFYGLHRAGKLSFLLEGYIDGTSLKNILRRRKGHPIPIEEILPYLKALSASLGYAHVNGVVHCDVKPGNVMVDRGGSVFLTDFGIARHAESTTTTLGLAGSPAYMAPEQIRGEPVSPATDVYALGVMIFEMLTGQRPFLGTENGTESGGTTAGERIRYAHLHLPPPDIRSLNSNISAQMVQVVLKALEKDPADRFRSVQELFQAVLGAAGIPYSSIPDRIPPEAGEQTTSTSSEPGPVKAGGLERFGGSGRVLAFGSVGLIFLIAGFWILRGGAALGFAYQTETVAPLIFVTFEVTSTSIPSPTSVLQATPPRRSTPTARPTVSPTPFVPQRPSMTPVGEVYYPLSGCAPSRLHVGDWAYVSYGGGKNAIRDEPDTHPSDNIIGDVFEGGSMEIVGGPICNWGLLLWEVRTFDGLEGWTPESDENEFWLTPGDDWVACRSAPNSRLRVGLRAAVSTFPPLANNVRERANTESTELGKIFPGEVVDIIGGPGCSGSFVWWEIRSLTTGLRGWTAEGDRENYWLVPIPK
jgi:serine/threonine protein kinase